MHEPEPDLIDVIGTLLTTEEGKNVTEALVDIKSAIDTQNKILVKILSALSSSDLEKK